MGSDGTRRPPHALSARTWRQYGYLWVALALAPIGFGYAVATPALAAFLAVTVVGLFVAGAFVLGARGWGAAYRGLARAALDAEVDDPPPFIRPPGFWASLRAVLLDATGWRALLFLLVTAPLTIVSFVVTTVVLGVGLAGVTYWAWEWALPPQPMPDGTMQRGLTILTTDGRYWSAEPASHQALVAVVGLVLLIVWPFLVGAFAALHRTLVRALLGPTAGAVRMATLHASRASALEDADARLRRIERDLHDGTQARLVAVAMQLGEAREHLATDPALAADLLDAAHASTKEALTELREIARGIHPPALDDGLAVALETLAARAPFGVVVRMEPDAEAGVSPAVRSIAYYTVAELLTNVAKHARATNVSVSVARPQDDLLHLRVRDDGRGGAAVVAGVPGGSGTGLAGLAERVATVDGTFVLDSPAGGPTVVDVTLPVSTRGTAPRPRT